MKTLIKFQKYMKGRCLLIPLSLFLSTLSALLSMLPFLLVWQIINLLLTKEMTIIDSRIIVYAWWALALSVGSLILYFLALLSSHLAAFRVEYNMRNMAMQKIIKMPLGILDSQLTGRMRKVIDDDVSTTHQFLAHQLPDLAGTIIMPILSLIFIFVFNWQLGLTCLVPILFSFLIMRNMMNGPGRKFMKRYLDAQEKMSSEAVEYVRGIPVVKVFQQSIFSFKRFYKSIILYKEMVIEYTNVCRKPMSIYIVLINSFAFFLVPVTVFLINQGGDVSTTLSDLLLYLLITPIFATNIMKSLYLQQSVFLADEALTRVEEMSNVEPLSVKKRTQKIIETSIRFEQVSFQYENSQNAVIDRVSFTIPQGKTYALVGPSGGGKTTLARLIPRFWDVQEGAVKIGEVNVKQIDKEELMNHISFVFQTSKLFKTTILNNVRYGKPDASLKEVYRALELSQCKEIIDRLPNGIHTMIGAEGTYLSGGEQQRIALARAILKDAPIVILDEATAFADPENEHLIQKALKELTKGKTVLMIAHRLTTIENVDRILVIDRGQIVEQGNHIDLLNQYGTYRRMWNEYQQAIKWRVQK